MSGEQMERSQQQGPEAAVGRDGEQQWSGETAQGGSPGSGSTAGSAGSQPNSVERAVGVAREQAGEAADAFRRGEFMQQAAVDPDASGDDRLIALLSYITQIVVPVFMPVIVLLSESSKRRPFQRYHAVQSLALTVTFMGLGIAALIGTAVIQIIPIIGQIVAFLVACLTPIAVLMTWIALLYYGFQAYQGKRFAVPGLTSMLRDQGWLP